MMGYFYFIFFFLLGIFIAYKTFYELPRVLRIWIGGLIGLLGMMWLVIPIAFFTGFTFFTHLVALIIMGGFSLLWFFLYHKPKDQPVVSIDYDTRIFWLVLPFSIYFIYLFYTHYLLPGQDGLYCGGNAYGDLAFHLGIITSFKEQQLFPPQYSIFPGIRMGYPFLVDSFTSSLYLLGMSLRHSLLLSSISMAVLLLTSFVVFAQEVLKKWSSTVIATLLFFINGGLGFFLISENFDHLVKKYQIDYILLSSQERSKYGEKIFQLIQKFPLVYQSQNSMILGVSERVRPLHDSILNQDSN
jgi:hypothetical protein